MCPIERKRLTNGRINLVKQKLAVLGRKNCKGKISNKVGKRPSKTEILLVIKTNINMMVVGLKVPCEKPVSFIQNLEQRAQVFILESGFNLTIVDVPKINNKTQFLSFRDC